MSNKHLLYLTDRQGNLEGVQLSAALWSHCEAAVVKALKMNEIIEQNFSNPELSVDYLAEQLCISRSGLFAKIKSLANITPNELIQLVRLKKAAVLLTENQYRISEISYMVGFNNPSYFAKCFQKQPSWHSADGQC